MYTYIENPYSIVQSGRYDTMWINAALFNREGRVSVDFQLPANAQHLQATLRAKLAKCRADVENACAAKEEASTALERADDEVVAAGRELMADPTALEHNLQHMSDLQRRQQTLKDKLAQTERQLEELEQRLLSLSTENAQLNVNAGVLLVWYI